MHQFTPPTFYKWTFLIDDWKAGQKVDKSRARPYEFNEVDDINFGFYPFTSDEW